MSQSLGDAVRELDRAMHALSKSEAPTRPSEVAHAVGILHMNIGRIAAKMTELAEWLEMNGEHMYSVQLGKGADAFQLVAGAAARLQLYAAALNEAERHGLALAAAVTQFDWRGDRVEQPSLRVVSDSST